MSERTQLLLAISVALVDEYVAYLAIEQAYGRVPRRRQQRGQEAERSGEIGELHSHVDDG